MYSNSNLLWLLLKKHRFFDKRSYKKTSFDQTTRRRDNETRRRDETTRRDNETTRRPNRGCLKSIPYFTNFWTPFFWTFSQPVQETTRQRDNKTTRQWDNETMRRRDTWWFPTKKQSLQIASGGPSRRLVVSLSRRLLDWLGKCPKKGCPKIRKVRYGF